MMILCNDCATVIFGWMLVSTIAESVSVTGARGRNRTGTPIRREILSLLCLPISPPGRMEGVEQTTVRIL